MSVKLFRDITLTVLVILALLVPVSAMAVDQPASSTDGAGAPLSEWVTIGPGESQYYMFKYHFNNSNKDSEPTEALVILKAADLTRSVNFSVQTAATLALPKYDRDGKLNGALGVGAPMFLREVHEHNVTANEYLRDKKMSDEHKTIQDWTTYVWAGSAGANETFYVVVKNSGKSVEAYKLSITGPEVSFP